MGAFKIYDCDFSVTINGIAYNFEQVDSLVIDDPETTRLVRGNNAGNKVGMVYREGVKDAKKITVTVLNMPKDIHDLLQSAYENETRMDVNCISRTDGSSKIAKDAILSQEPKQLNLDDSPEAMNVALNFESYNVKEVRKT